jgi:hypothetical protein
MNHGILLASFPNTENSLAIGARFLDFYTRNFPTATVYVGINPAPLQDRWIDMLKASSLEIFYAITPEELSLNSDASAYQTALKLVKEQNKEHDLLWFTHFKSVTNTDTKHLANDLASDLLSNPAYIEDVFKDPSIGLYGINGWTYNQEVADYISPYFSFPYTNLGVQVLWTFFVLRADPVMHFLNNCSDNFFNTRLPHRYFFENDFYQVVFRQGYLPHIRDFMQSSNGTRSYAEKIAQWKVENKLP